MNPETKKSKPINFKRVITILLFLAALIVILSPMVMQPTGPGHSRIQTTSNVKQIGIALFTFEQDYGSYPSKETAKKIADAFPDHGYNLNGDSSNALFLQLLACDIAPTEEIFYARIKNTQPPDGIITPGEALKKGEVGFAYISGLNHEAHSSRPLVLTPLIPGTTKFDPKPFDGHAIALHIDLSVKAYKIRKDGTIHDKDGDILSPEHPFWNGTAPDIRYPE